MCVKSLIRVLCSSTNHRQRQFMYMESFKKLSSRDCELKIIDGFIQ